MKKLALILLAGMTFSSLRAQEIKTDLKPFCKVIASPRINLVLQKGDQESIRLVYSRITPDKINIKQHGKTLHIYLDDAKVAERTTKTDYVNRKGIYEDVNITAFVTYRTLDELEIRGSQELSCLDPIRSESFTLRAYGENEITLASVKTGYLRTKLYGENNLKINNGKAEFQKYSLYGENDIDTRLLKSYSATANLFGESKLKLSTEDELKINSFGEGKVFYNGNAQVNRRIIIGNAEIARMD